ncbi:hypothetical protein PVAP13_6KG416606 [Panicum virgatum]|uniref:Uncharacterized protein n=1 Tax=Panicum virgatum TaxID=38727 RepID=A0A8T0RIX4_PANVG|nr:hypothetical protein PVAP13_6KG416606 [Panicum virgatum]
MVLLASLHTAAANDATTATIANTRAKPLSTHTTTAPLTHRSVGRPDTAGSGVPSAAVARPPAAKAADVVVHALARNAPPLRASCSERRRSRHRSAAQRCARPRAPAAAPCHARPRPAPRHARSRAPPPPRPAAPGRAPPRQVASAATAAPSSARPRPAPRAPPRQVASTAANVPPHQATSHAAAEAAPRPAKHQGGQIRRPGVRIWPRATGNSRRRHEQAATKRERGGGKERRREVGAPSPPSSWPAGLPVARRGSRGGGGAAPAVGFRPSRPWKERRGGL